MSEASDMPEEATDGSDGRPQFTAPLWRGLLLYPLQVVLLGMVTNAALSIFWYQRSFAEALVITVVAGVIAYVTFLVIVESAFAVLAWRQARKWAEMFERLFGGRLGHVIQRDASGMTDFDEHVDMDTLINAKLAHRARVWSAWRFVMRHPHTFTLSKWGAVSGATPTEADYWIERRLMEEVDAYIKRTKNQSE